MSSDRLDGLEGLTVRVRDGRTIGVVVGVFAEGLLAGRLRVQGEYTSFGRRRGSQDGIAVYAIPRQAVVRQLRDSLVLDTTLSAALLGVRRRRQTANGLDGACPRGIRQTAQLAH